MSNSDSEAVSPSTQIFRLFSQRQHDQFFILVSFAKVEDLKSFLSVRRKQHVKNEESAIDPLFALEIAFFKSASILFGL